MDESMKIERWKLQTMELLKVKLADVVEVVETRDQSIFNAGPGVIPYLNYDCMKIVEHPLLFSPHHG